MLKQTAVALLVATALVGCKSTPKQVCTPDTRVDLQTAEVPVVPVDDQRVIVLPVDFDFDDPSKGKVKSVLRNQLEAQISASGAKLVDRKIANKLKDEIKLAEQSGRYNSKGVPIADFAVLTEVTTAELSKSYTEARKWKDDDGEVHYRAPSCSYDVDVKAIAKVYSLPEMELVERIELDGDDYASTETRSSSCPLSNAQYTSMASAAANEAVEYSTTLKQMLAPSASVLELRQCEAGNMVKISMGKNKRVTPGADVAFSKLMKSHDGEVETFSIGEGTVVDIPNHGIKQKYSWVAIDEKIAIDIQEGNEAKIIHGMNCSFLDLECHSKDKLGF